MSIVATALAMGVLAALAMLMGFLWSRAKTRRAVRIALEQERKRFQAMSPTDPEYNKVREQYAAAQADATRVLGKGHDGGLCIVGADGGGADGGGGGGD